MERAEQKLAIVLSGGGMRCAYGAGFLTALIEEFSFSDPDILIAASGSAGGALYYLARQPRYARMIWTNLLASREFISMRRWPIMNIDYLIDFIFKKEAPLDIRQLRLSQTSIFIPITDVTTGTHVYATREEVSERPYEVLRAAKAIPILSGEKVQFRHRSSIDGDFGSTLVDHIDKALNEGTTTLIVVHNTYDHIRFLERIILRWYSRYVGAYLRHTILRDIARTNTERFSIPHAVRTVHVIQERPASVFTRSRKKLAAAFNAGYRAAVENAELRAILQEHERNRAQKGAA